MQNLMSFKTIILLMLIQFFLLLNPANLILAKPEETKVGFTNELKDFDDMVRQSRQQMRKSCAIVQDLIKQVDAQKQAKGVEYIRQSIALWEKVQQKFQNTSPAEYQQDSKFNSRLTTILKGMRDMEKQLVDGKFKESLQVCGATCGLFVTMHEENGLVYAADRLFHLRKLAKQMIDTEQKSDLHTIKGMLGELLKLRNDVFLAPCPARDDEARCNDYRSALISLSAQLDNLALAIQNDDQVTAENVFKNLISSINLVYGIAL